MTDTQVTDQNRTWRRRLLTGVIWLPVVLCSAVSLLMLVTIIADQQSGWGLTVEEAVPRTLEERRDSLNFNIAASVCVIAFAGGAFGLASAVGIVWVPAVIRRAGGEVSSPATFFGAFGLYAAAMTLVALFSESDDTLAERGVGSSSLADALRAGASAGLTEELVDLVLLVGLPLALVAHRWAQWPLWGKVLYVAPFFAASVVWRGGLHTYQGGNRAVMVGVLGVAAVVIFLFARTVWPFILVHAAWNTLAYTIGDADPNSGFGRVHAIFLTVAVVALLISMALHRYRHAPGHQSPAPSPSVPTA